MKKHVAIYARVSTGRQSHNSQLEELREFCRARGYEEVQEYCDVISGAKAERKALGRMMENLRRGKVSVVIAAKLDRLARSLNHLALILEELNSHGVALIVPGQSIDTSSANPAARFQLAILGAVAAFERDLIRERVNAGLSAAKANGVRLGRPPKLLRRREEIIALRDAGLSIREIGRQLGINCGSISRLLKAG